MPLDRGTDQRRRGARRDSVAVVITVGHLDIAYLFLPRAADMNAQPLGHATVLITAFKLVLEYGTDVNA